MTHLPENLARVTAPSCSTTFRVRFWQVRGCAIALAAVAILPVAYSQQTGNRLQNPGFENDFDRNGKADAWFTHPAILQASSDPVIETIRDADMAADGQCFLRLSQSGGKAPLSVTLNIKDAALESIKANLDSTLVLKGKIRSKSESPAEARINIQIFAKPQGGGDSKFAGAMQTETVSAGPEWEEVSTSLNLADILPAGSELVLLEANLLLVSPSGSVDFDDLSLEEKAP